MKADGGVGGIGSWECGDELVGVSIRMLWAAGGEAVVVEGTEGCTCLVSRHVHFVGGKKVQV